MDSIEVFRNKNNVKEIMDFLNKLNKYKAILIRGPIGSGKVTLIKSCLHKLNLTYTFFNPDQEQVELEEVVTFERGPKAVIIRNIEDSLKSSVRNKFYKFIGKQNECLKYIFITSHETAIGIVREIPKFVLQLTFEKSCLVDLIKLGLTKSPTSSKNSLETLARKSRGDISWFLENIKTIKYDVIKHFHTDTFDCIKQSGKLDKNWSSVADISSAYTNATVYHNYPKMIKQVQKAEARKVIDLICLAEELRNYAYSAQEWDIFEKYYSVIGTIMPMIIIGDIDDIKLTYPPNISIIADSDFDHL